MIKKFSLSGWSSSIISDLAASGLQGGELIAFSPDKQQALSELLAHIENHNRNKKFVFISGHDAWQPDNRIVNHRKFWKSFNFDHQLQEQKEWSIANLNKVKYFTAAPVKGNEWILNSKVLDQCTSWIVSVGMHVSVDEIAEFFSAGWACEWKGNIPVEIINFTRIYNALSLRSFGPTNINEEGFIIIGKYDYIEELTNKSLV